MNFKYSVPSSKSLVNRCLILNQGMDLNLSWSAGCKDIRLLDQSLKRYKTQKELEVGQGGTTLRFLALFLSTQKGEWVLKGEPSLFSRPQEDLLGALVQLGAEATLEPAGLVLKSQGWVEKTNLKLSCLKSSQVLTACVLAAVSQNQPIHIKVCNYDMASGYFQMTLDLLSQLEVPFEWSENNFSFLRRPQVKKYISVEGDWSTAAFLFALGALFGKVHLDNLNLPSLQPDHVFFDLLKKMNVHVQEFFCVSNKNKMKQKGVEANLKNSPDLFPVLCVLAALSNGTSYFYGAPQLEYKESPRISSMKQLLSICGYKTELVFGGLKIFGQGFQVLEHKLFEFDVSKDHRLFMAAEILKKVGYQISIKGVKSIEKSFPEYLQIKDQM